MRPALSHPRPRHLVWRRGHPAAASHGHSRPADHATLTVAERACRTADRVDPTRVPRPAPPPSVGELRHLLQRGAHAPCARQGCSAPSTCADSRAYRIGHLARRSPSALRSDGIIGTHRHKFGESGMAEETTEATAPDVVTGDAGPLRGTGEPPSLSAVATAFAAKARDLETLRDAVIDAASVGGGLWLSYLFVLLYLLIAVGSVTHRDLFLESPVKLPFLSVELPLLGFFWLGPLIFLIVHAYVLLHFVLLAGKVGYFNEELKAQIKDEEVR